MKRNSKLYLIISLCMMAACSIGLYMNSFGVFFTAIAETLNEKRGSVALVYTLMALSAAVFSTVIPPLINNRNYKKFFVAGVAGSVGTVVLLANAGSLLMMYVGGILLGGFFSTYFMVILTTIINCSFTENVGTITGIVFSFSGIAGAVFSPLFASIIEAHGWRVAFYVMAAVAVILCLPGMFADMKVEQEKKENTEQSASFNFLAAGYILIVVMNVCYMYLPALPQHFSGLASSKGLSEVGPLLVSAAMIGNIVFKLVAGVLADKLGAMKSILIMGICNLTGSALLLTSKTKLLVLAAAFMFGAIYAITAVLNALLVKTIYGTDNYKKAYSIVALAGNTFNALAIAAVGYIYDFTGSYDPALLLGMVLNVTAFALAALSVRKQPQEN